MLNKAQKKASKKITKKLKKFGIACLWGEARSGKSRAFLEASRPYKTLVITEKSAIDGVLSEAKEIDVAVDCINYQSVHKMNPKAYELIICDESHRFISPSQPKPPITWKEVVKFTKGKLLILASATPTSEGYGGLYYQLALSDRTPFKFVRFTKFFEEFGVPNMTYIGTRQVPNYKETKVDAIKSGMKQLVVKLKRVDTGHKFESQDEFHKVEMNKQQLKIIGKLEDHSLYIKKDYEVLADTGVKFLGKLHQLAGGIGVICEPEYVNNKPKQVVLMLNSVPEKVEYILKHFDIDTTMILSYYTFEQKYLAKVFPHTGSVTKLSTGVDLSHYKTLIIYSMGFSASNFFQVKARLMNINRDTQMTVHYLVSGIDNYILKAVRSKENFTSSWFKKNEVRK